MVLSENGWTAHSDTSSFTRATACGLGFWAANPDVAFVFSRLIAAFDAKVEKIKGPVLDDWSYANRLVRGSTSVVSNHGSATAIDLNALKHPRGKRGTFSSTQVKAIRAILKDLPVVKWGGDFHTTVDEMHFEINAKPEALSAFVKALKEREEMKPEDFDKIRAIFVDVLKNEHIVPNIPTDGSSTTTSWTTTGAEAANDLKLDKILEILTAQK